MEKNKTVIKVNENWEVFCYGELEESSNFEVVFDDEEHDLIWITRDPSELPDWQSIVSHWVPYCVKHGVEVWEISSDSSY
jgi:hypothetical protein